MKVSPSPMVEAGPGHEGGGDAVHPPTLAPEGPLLGTSSL